MVQETGIQSLIKSYQKLKKWYLLNTQHYKVRIKGKVEQSRGWSSPPLHLGVLTIEKGGFKFPLTKIANFLWCT